MPKLNFNPEQLQKVIQPTFIIDCSTCNKEDKIMTDTVEHAAEYFFKRGWRVTPAKHVYCPTHALKHLKNQ